MLGIGQKLAFGNTLYVLLFANDFGHVLTEILLSREDHMARTLPSAIPMPPQRWLHGETKGGYMTSRDRLVLLKKLAILHSWFGSPLPKLDVPRSTVDTHRIIGFAET